MGRIALAAAALSLAATACTNPAATAPQSASASIAPADAAAIDAVIDGVYAIISGPPGQKRDFDAMRAMFAPGATLKVISPRGVRGGGLEDYIRQSGPILEKEGFTETELGRRVELYGNLAHVWSSYAGRTASGSFNERGINSFQLVRVDGRWLVASILWQEETPQYPLPADMLNNGK